MAVYACSDLHGYYKLYEQIDNYITPEDQVIFLGDAGDRGPDSFKTIRAIASNPRWIYLKGNHEDMTQKAIDEWLNDYSGSNTRLSIWNGGEQTLSDIVNSSSPEGWSRFFKELPISFFYKSSTGRDIYLTHAGFTPKLGVVPIENDLIWDRSHITDDPDPLIIPEVYKDTLIVHGHTPIWADTLAYAPGKTWLGAEEHSPIIYADGRKLDIDAGTYYSKETYLVNLDTLEFITFKINQ